MNEYRGFLSYRLGGIIGLLFAASWGLAQNADPRPPESKSLQSGVTLSLFTEHPEIATPTGIDVDEEGRVWAVACHTHFPPDDYTGPDTDEILVFAEGGSERSLFYDKTVHTMDLELGEDGWVYLAERDRILRIKDQDGDGRADVEENLAVLETESDYPHNGLAALAFHPESGELHFGLGENFAKGWTLTGSDGTVYRGNGEGGVFRCKVDGSELHRIARGMWNPFGLLIRPDGEIFACENDPGERPPCRLLHIVEGGNYGYQRLFGNEAHHPFVCWNGELSGTLPMVRPVGEGPCGVAQLGRGLLIPSWSDHRLDFYPLEAEGASYRAERIQLLGGSRYFRPVCIAEDPRSANENRRVWYFTDWVDGSYKVHGYGRIWKLEIDLGIAKEDWLAGPLALPKPTALRMLAADLRAGDIENTQEELFEFAESADSHVAQAAIHALSSRANTWDVAFFKNLPSSRKRTALAALRVSEADSQKWISHLLKEKPESLRFETLRWIAEAQLKDWLPAVEEELEKAELSLPLLEAAIATRNTLLGKPEGGYRDADLLKERVLDIENTPVIRARALRLLGSPKKPASRLLGVEELKKLLSEKEPILSMEVVRAIPGNDLLLAVAQDSAQSEDVRTEAIANLEGLVDSSHSLLLQLASSESSKIRSESLRQLRTLRGTFSEEQKETLSQLAETFPQQRDLVEAILQADVLITDRPLPSDTAAWLAQIDQLEGAVDPEIGSRIFHNSRLGLCSQCHRYKGRGTVVGPDLSSVALRNDRAWLLQSILDPNAALAPEYLPRTMHLKDGRSVTGIRLRSSKSEVVRDASGQSQSFSRDAIESIEELEVSLMPPGLVYNLTLSELRDLLAYLESSSPLAN